MPQSIALVLIDCLYCGSKSKVPNSKKARLSCPYCGHRLSKGDQGTPKGLPVD